MARRALHEAGTVRVDFVSGHARTHAGGEASQKRGLAAGARTQVEPTFVRPALQRCGCSDKRRELRAFILGASASITNRGQTRGVAGFEEDRVRRHGAQGNAGVEDILGLVCELVNAHQRRAGHQRDRGNRVIGHKDVDKLVLGISVGLEGVAERGDHPRRV